MLSSYWSKRAERENHKGVGFGDNGRTNPHGASFDSRAYTKALNATALALLQADALEALSAPSDRVHRHSTFKISDGQMRVDTQSGSGQVDTMLIKSERTKSNGNLIATSLLTNLEIVSSKEGIVSNSHARVRRDSNALNELVDPGTGRLTVEHIDAGGDSALKFEPAVRKSILDKKDQTVSNHDGTRMNTEPAGERANCRVPFSGRSECNYILRNQSIADSFGVAGGAVALNVIIDERKRREFQRKLIDESLNIKIILRSLDGRSLGSLEQQVKLDQNGNIAAVDTEARRLRRRN